MDCSFTPDQNQHATQFQKESNIQHLCCHTCRIEHEFGNVFKCQQSGLRHVCDANCSSRVYRDRYSSICLLSGKVHGPLEQQLSAENSIGARKRGPSCSQDGADLAKRMISAVSGFGGPQSYAQPMEA